MKRVEERSYLTSAGTSCCARFRPIVDMFRCGQVNAEDQISCHQEEEVMEEVISDQRNPQLIRCRMMSSATTTTTVIHSASREVERKTRLANNSNNNQLDNSKSMALKPIHLFILILFALKFAVITCEQTATATSATTSNPDPLATNHHQDRRADQVHANLSSLAEQQEQPRRDYDYDNDDEDHNNNNKSHSKLNKSPGDDVHEEDDDTRSLRLSLDRQHGAQDDEQDQLVGSESMRVSRRQTKDSKPEASSGNSESSAFESQHHSPVTELSRLDSNATTNLETGVQLHKIDSTPAPSPQPQQVSVSRLSRLSESHLPLDLLRQKPNATQVGQQVAADAAAAPSAQLPLPEQQQLLDDPELIGDHNYLHFDRQQSEDEQQVNAADSADTKLALDGHYSADNLAGSKRNVDATLEARAKLQDTVTQLHYNKTLALAGSSSIKSSGNNYTGSGLSSSSSNANRWAQSGPPQSDSFDNVVSSGGAEYEQPFNQELSSSIVSVAVTMAPTNVVEYLNEQRSGSDLLEAADELQQQRHNQLEPSKSSKAAAAAAADWGRRKSAAAAASRSRPQVRLEQPVEQQQQSQAISLHQQQRQQSQNESLPASSASYEDIVTWTPAAGPAAYRAGSGYGPSSAADQPAAAMAANSSSGAQPFVGISNINATTEPFSELLVFPAPITISNLPSGAKKRNGTGDYMMSGSSLDYVANETQNGGFTAAEPPSGFKRGQQQQRMRLKSQPAMIHLKKPVVPADGEYVPESSDELPVGSSVQLPGQRRQEQQQNGPATNDDDDGDDPDEEEENEGPPAKGRGRHKTRGPMLQADSLHGARNYMQPIRASSEESNDETTPDQPQSEGRFRDQLARAQRPKGRGGFRQKVRKQPNEDWDQQQQQQRRPHQQNYDRPDNSVQWSPTLAPVVRDPPRYAHDSNQQVSAESRNRQQDGEIVLGSRGSPESDELPRPRATSAARYPQAAEQGGFRGSTSTSSGSNPPIIRTFRVSDEVNFSPVPGGGGSSSNQVHSSYYNGSSSSSSAMRPAHQQEQPYEAGARFQASQHRQVSYNPSVNVGDISMVRPARPQQQLVSGFAPQSSHPAPIQPARNYQSSSFAPIQQQHHHHHQQPAHYQQSSYQDSSFNTPFEPPRPQQLTTLDNQRAQSTQYQNQYVPSRFNAPPAQTYQPPQQQMYQGHQVYQQMSPSQVSSSGQQEHTSGYRQHFQQAPRTDQQVRTQMNDHYNNGSPTNASWSIVTLPYPQPTNNPQSYFSLYTNNNNNNNNNLPVQRQTMQQAAPSSSSAQIYNYNKAPSPSSFGTGWSNSNQPAEMMSQEHSPPRPAPVTYVRQVGNPILGDHVNQRASMFNMPAPQLSDSSSSSSRGQVMIQQATQPQQQQNYHQREQVVSTQTESPTNSLNQDSQSVQQRGARNVPAVLPPTNAHNSYLTINLKTHAAVGPNQLFWEAAAREVAQQQQQQQQQSNSNNKLLDGSGSKVPVTNGHLPPQHRELSAGALPMMRRPLSSIRFPLQEPFMASSHTNGHAYAGQLKSPQMAAAALMMADHLSELAQLQSMSANPHEISYVDPHSFYPLSLAPPLDADAFNFMTSAATMPASAFVSPAAGEQATGSSASGGGAATGDVIDFAAELSSSNGQSNSSQLNKKGSTAVISSALPLATPSTVSDPFGWPMGYGSRAATTLLKVNHVAPPPPYLVPAKVTAAQSSALFYPTMIEPGTPGATALPVKEDPSILSQRPFPAESSAMADYELQWPGSPMLTEYSMLQPQVWASPEQTSSNLNGAGTSESRPKLNHIKVELNTRPPATTRRDRLKHLLRMFSNMRTRSPNGESPSRSAINFTDDAFGDLINDSGRSHRQKRSIVTNLVTNLMKHPATLLSGQKSENANTKAASQSQQVQVQKPPKLALINLSDQTNQSHNGAQTGFIPLLDNANMIESMESDLLAQAIIFNHQNPQGKSTLADQSQPGRDPMEQLSEAHSMRVVSHAPLNNQPVSHADPPSPATAADLQQSMNMQLQQHQQQQQQQQQQQIAQDSNLMLYMPLEETASLSPPANEPNALDHNHQQSGVSRPVISSRERLKRLSKSIIRSSRKPFTKLIKMTSGFRLPLNNSSSSSSSGSTGQQAIGNTMAGSHPQVSVAQKLNTVVSPSVMMAPPSVPSINNFNRFALPLQQWYQYQMPAQVQQNQLSLSNELAKFRPSVVAPPSQQHQQHPSLPQPHLQHQQHLLPLAGAQTQQMSPYSLLTSASAKQHRFSQPVQVHFGPPPPPPMQQIQSAPNQPVSQLPTMEIGQFEPTSGKLSVSPNVSFPSQPTNGEQLITSVQDQPPTSNLNGAAPSGGINRASGLLSSPQRADSMNRFAQALTDLQLYNRHQLNLIAPLLKMSKSIAGGNTGNSQVPPHRSALLLDFNHPLRREVAMSHFRRSNSANFQSPPPNTFNLSISSNMNHSSFPAFRQQWYPPSPANRNLNSWPEAGRANGAQSELARLSAIKRDFNMRFKPSARTRQLTDTSDLELFYKPGSNVTYTDEVYSPTASNVQPIELSGNELADASTMLSDGSEEANLSQLMGSASSVDDSQLTGTVFNAQDTNTKLSSLQEQSSAGSGDFTLEQQQQFQQLLNQQHRQNLMQFNPFNGLPTLPKPRLPKIIPSINSMANKFRQQLFQTLKLNPLASKWPTLATYPKYQASTNYMALPSMPLEAQAAFPQQQPQPQQQQPQQTISVNQFQQKPPVQLESSQVNAANYFGAESQMTVPKETQLENPRGHFHGLQQEVNQQNQHQQQQHQFQHQNPQQTYQQVMQSSGSANNEPPSGVHMDEMGAMNGEATPIEDNSVVYSDKPMVEANFRPDNESQFMNFSQVNGTSMSDGESSSQHSPSMDMYDQELLNQHSMQTESLPGMMMSGNGSDNSLSEFDHSSDLFASNQTLMGVENQINQHQQHELVAPLRNGMTDVSNNLLTSDGTYIPEKPPVKSMMHNYTGFSSPTYLKDDGTDPTLYHNRNLSAAASTDNADVTIHHHHVITSDDTDSTPEKLDQMKQHMMSTGMESPVHPGGLESPNGVHQFQSAEDESAAGNTTNEQQQQLGPPEGVAYQANFESSRTGNGSLEEPEEQQQQLQQLQQQQYEAERVQVRPVANYHMMQPGVQRQRKVQANPNAQVQVAARIRAYSNVSEQVVPMRQTNMAEQQQTDYQVIKASDPQVNSLAQQASPTDQSMGAFRVHKVHLPDSMIPNGIEQTGEPNIASTSSINGEASGESSEDQQQQLGGQQVYEPDGLGGGQMMFNEQSIGEQQEHQPPPPPQPQQQQHRIEMVPNQQQQQQQQKQQQQHNHRHVYLEQLQPPNRSQVVVGHYKPLNPTVADNSLEYNFTPVFPRFSDQQGSASAGSNFTHAVGAGERLVPAGANSTRPPVAWRTYRGELQVVTNNGSFNDSMQPRGSPRSATTIHEQYLVLDPQPPASGSHGDASLTSVAANRPVATLPVELIQNSSRNSSELPAVFVSVKPERVVQRPLAQVQPHLQVRRQPLKMPKSARPRNQQQQPLQNKQVNSSSIINNSNNNITTLTSIVESKPTVQLTAGRPTTQASDSLSHMNTYLAGSELHASQTKLNLSTTTDDNIRNHNLKPTTAKPALLTRDSFTRPPKSRIRWQGMSGNRTATGSSGNSTAAAGAASSAVKAGQLEPASSELSRREQAYMVSKMTAAAYAPPPSEATNSTATPSPRVGAEIISPNATSPTATSSPHQPAPPLSNHKTLSSYTAPAAATNSSAPATASATDRPEVGTAKGRGPEQVRTAAGLSHSQALRAAARAHPNHKRASTRPDARTGSTSFRLSTSGASGNPPGTATAAAAASVATPSPSSPPPNGTLLFSERPTVFVDESAALIANSTFTPRSGQVELAPPTAVPELSLALASASSSSSPVNQTAEVARAAVQVALEQQHLREDSQLAAEDRLAAQVRKRRHREPSAQLIDLLKMSAGRPRSRTPLDGPEVREPAELRVRLANSNNHNSPVGVGSNGSAPDEAIATDMLNLAHGAKHSSD